MDGSWHKYFMTFVDARSTDNALCLLRQNSVSHQPKIHCLSYPLGTRARKEQDLLSRNCVCTYPRTIRDQKWASSSPIRHCGEGASNQARATGWERRDKYVRFQGIRSVLVILWLLRFQPFPCTVASEILSWANFSWFYSFIHEIIVHWIPGYRDVVVKLTRVLTGVPNVGSKPCTRMKHTQMSNEGVPGDVRFVKVSIKKCD